MSIEQRQDPSSVQTEQLKQATNTPESKNLAQKIDKHFTAFSDQQKQKITSLLQQQQKLNPETPIVALIKNLKEKLAPSKQEDETEALLNQEIQSLRQQILEREDIQQGSPLVSTKFSQQLTNTQEKENIAQEKESIKQQDNKITQEKEDIAQEKEDIAQEKENIAQEKENIKQQDNKITQEKESIKQQDNKITQEKESIKQQDNKITQEKESIVQEKENISETQKHYLKTHQKRLALDPQHRQASPQAIQSKIDTLSPHTQHKLQQHGIKLEHYASFLLSKEALINQPQDEKTSSFLDSLQTLQDSLEIRGERFPQSFKPDAEFIRNNPDLITFAKDHPSMQIFDQTYFALEEMEPAEALDFAKNFGDKKLQTLINNYTPLLSQVKDFDQISHFSPQEQTIILHYRNALAHTMQTLEQKSTNLLKISATNAPIPFLMQYLDQQTLGDQSLKDALNGNHPNAVTIHPEGNDQIMHIKGKINGNPITFYYNLTNPNSPLQCDDHLHYDPTQWHILLSTPNNSLAKTNLNIQMPTIQEFNQQLADACNPQTMQKLLLESKDTKEYQNKLHNHIQKTFTQQYKEDNLISSRLSRHTEKNLAIHTLSSTLIPTDIMQQLTSGKQLNENTTTKKLFTLIDKSSEHMSSSELQTFRKNLQKWGVALQSPDTIKKIQDPILRSCLEKCASAQKMSSNFQVRNDAMLQFFNLFTTQNIQQKNLDTDHENYILNGSDFNTFIEHLDSPQQTIYADHHLQRFSPNFSQKYHYLREQTSKTADHNALTQLEEEMTASFDHAFV